MSVHAYGALNPRVDATAFIAPGARVVGDVEVGPEASVWFNAVLRGDSASVSVGACTNVQDGAVLHTDEDAPCVVGEACTIGHRAVVHGCRVESGSLIGMGAIVLSGAVIGAESLVAAGALVAERRTFAPRSLIMGTPARVVRTLSDEDVDRLIRPGVAHYLDYVRTYRNSG